MNPSRPPLPPKKEGTSRGVSSILPSSCSQKRSPCMLLAFLCCHPRDRAARQAPATPFSPPTHRAGFRAGPPLSGRQSDLPLTAPGAASRPPLSLLRLQRLCPSCEAPRFRLGSHNHHLTPSPPSPSFVTFTQFTPPACPETDTSARVVSETYSSVPVHDVTPHLRHLEQLYRHFNCREVSHNSGSPKRGGTNCPGTDSGVSRVMVQAREV